MKGVSIVMCFVAGCSAVSPARTTSKLKTSSESAISGDRSPGEPCSQDEECETAACVTVQGKSVCAASCADGVPCDGGLMCQKRNPRDASSPTICAERVGAECSTCNTDADCGSYGRACMQAVEGKVCGIDCTVSDNNCPLGFTCVALVSASGESLSRQCVPEPSTCFCAPGQTDLCTQWTPPMRLVDSPKTPSPAPSGSALDPHEPAVTEVPANCVPKTETCNGLDDDCDGRIDEGVDNKTLEETCGNAACGGVRVCHNGVLSACNARLPTTETCNGIDDDCDGQVDEGLLSSVDQCGTCGNVCPGAGQEATLTRACEATATQYQCAPTKCRGDHYDADGDLSNGCEALDDSPMRGTTATAFLSANGIPVLINDNSNNSTDFTGHFGADARPHDAGASNRSSPIYAAAFSNDWYRVNAYDSWDGDMEIRALLDVRNLPSSSLYEVCMSPHPDNGEGPKYASCGARPADNPLSWCTGMCCCAYGGQWTHIPLSGNNTDVPGEDGGDYYVRVTWKSGTFVPGQSMNSYGLRVCDDGQQQTCPIGGDCGLPKHCEAL